MSVDSPYDPSAPEDSSPGRSAYVSAKDIRVVGVAVLVLALLMYPIFQVLERRSEKAHCINNMKGIMDSINQYAAQNEDKFPPLFESGSNDEPMLQSSGSPYTWASVIQEYMKPRDSFRCPSATKEELSWSQDSQTTQGSFPLSYGMFAPMSGFNRSLVEDPEEAVLIGETSNLGARDTYDPLPFTDSNGQRMPYDGMVIGWDTDNFDGGDKTRLVTRLAFPGTGKGVFNKEGAGRHDEGTFVLTVAGQLRTVKPNIAQVTRRYGKLYGYWPMPLTAKRHP